MTDNYKHGGCGCGHKQRAHELAKRPVAVKVETQASCCSDSQASDAASGHDCCGGDGHGDHVHADNHGGHSRRAAPEAK